MTNIYKVLSEMMGDGDGRSLCRQARLRVWGPVCPPAVGLSGTGLPVGPVRINLIFVVEEY